MTEAGSDGSVLGRALVVTASNRASAGVYEDRGGPLLADGLRRFGFSVDGPLVVPDGDPVTQALRDAVQSGYDVVLTTGGTGLSPTDRTPDATLSVIDREVPGIAESIRARGVNAGIATAALSRGIAGLAGRTLIVNLPGSPGGCKDGLSVLADLLPHAVDRCVGVTMLEAGTGASWPVELTDGVITLRPLARRDGRSWNAVRTNNAAWLAPWEATRPEGIGRPLTFAAMVRGFDREAKAGRMLPLAVQVDGRLIGQVTVSAIVWGSLRSGQIGYWIDRSEAGRGIVPTSVAMMVDHCFFGLGMHRLEVNIRPENEASLRVVEKLGFRPEGVRRKYLHIDGEWRDHATFALTPEDVPGGLLTRWRRAQRVLGAHNGLADHGLDGLSGSGHAGGTVGGQWSRPPDDGPWSHQSPGTPARHTVDGA